MAKEIKTLHFAAERPTEGGSAFLHSVDSEGNILNVTTSIVLKVVEVVVEESKMLWVITRNSVYPVVLTNPDSKGCLLELDDELEEYI